MRKGGVSVMCTVNDDLRGGEGKLRIRVAIVDMACELK